MEQAERDRLRAWLRPSPSIPLGKSVPLAHWNMFSAGRVHFSFKTPSFRQIISHLAYLNQMQVPFLTRKFPFFFLAQPTVKVVNSGKSFVMKCESCYPVCFAHAPPLLPVANKTWAFCLERWRKTLRVLRDAAGTLQSVKAPSEDSSRVMLRVGFCVPAGNRCENWSSKVLHPLWSWCPLTQRVLKHLSIVTNLLKFGDHRNVCHEGETEMYKITEDPPVASSTITAAGFHMQGVSSLRAWCSQSKPGVVWASAWTAAYFRVSSIVSGTFI